MSLKFYTDTHIPKQVAIQLRRRGIDVVRCEEVNMAEADDGEHLVYSAQENRVLVTKDDDFVKLNEQWHADGVKHAGIFYCIHREIPAVGLIVTFCSEMVDFITGGAADIKKDIENQVIYIS